MRELFTRRDASTVVEVVSETARAEIVPRFRRLMPGSTREKSSSFDIVTEADEATERRIAERLHICFPDAAVIGEEAASSDPTILDQIGSADLAFIVDPLDGTKNFASGLPLFGVMVAATIRGEVVFGAIHDPISGDTSIALRGEGAWQQGENGATVGLSVAAPVPIEQMQGVAGTNFLPEPLRTTVALNLSKIGMSFWLRCAAHEYRLAAAGHCHLLVYNRLMPWDHAAGWLLHREAGGHSAHFDGSAYLPTHTTGGLICATDRESWTTVRDALLQGPGIR